MLVLVLAGCADAPRSVLPPSATDLPLLTPGSLCTNKRAFLDQQSAQSVETLPWGRGEEVRVTRVRDGHRSIDSYFFDADHQLVGAVFIFPRAGLPLKPYPVLRDTLSQLMPDMEFFLPGASVASSDEMSSGVLYRTGDEKSTMAYLVSGEKRDAVLRIASIAIDPYEKLLSPYRPDFVSRLGHSGEGPLTMMPREPDQQGFESLQEFARGEAAQLGYCGARQYERAAEAYQKALEIGLPDKVRTAEAHHRLGLAYQGQGQFADAREQMEKSLTINPNTPEVLNNLATVYGKLGERDKAIKALERAITLRPNYALARYNLAEMVEPVNPKRAGDEYATYLALVEGVREEADRAAIARERVKALGRR